MIKLVKIFMIVFSVLIIGCNVKDTGPLFKKDTTQINEKNNTLFAFVGEKIEVKDLPLKEGALDAGTKAKYKVLQKVYGSYAKDTIEFEAYDHYEYPAFVNYQHALLFVTEQKGKYYHQKYQYFDVYKTKKGEWASSYKVDNKDPSVKPEKIDFIDEVSYPVANMEKTEIKRLYPEPYYKILGDKAIAVYGNYIKELFLIKKNGVLLDRGLFGNKPYKEIEVRDVETMEVKVDSTLNK